MFKSLFNSLFKKKETKEDFDDELKELLKPFYHDLIDMKRAKIRAFSTLIKIEEEYNFKSDDPVKNKRKKKDLMIELEYTIMSILKG